MHLLVLLSAGMPRSGTVGEPGTQGAGVAGMQGAGVNTPALAAVAAITAGLGRRTTHPKGHDVDHGNVIANVGRGTRLGQYSGIDHNER